MKRLVSLMVMISMLILASAAWAITSPPMTTKALVVAPTALTLNIVNWAGRTAPINTIDYSLGATGSASPGATSWVDSDTFASLDANVGFTAIVTSEGSAHSFTVSCGKMASAGIYEIPYSVTVDTVTTNYFGFSLKKNGVYVLGSATAMQPHSLAGSTVPVAAGVYGTEFSVFNLLQVPVTQQLGQYATTGVGNYAHLTVTWI